MTDEATVTVAEAPTAPATHAPQPAPTPEAKPEAAKPSGPTDRRTSRHAAVERSAERAARGKESPAAEKPAAPTTEPAEEPKADEPSEKKPEAPAETPKPDAAKPAEAPKAISVAIPEDHPVRGMGQAKIEVRTEQEARALRALLNGTYTRRSDLQERDNRIRELEEYRARREAEDEATQEWRQTPEYQSAVEQYNQIRDTVSEEAANRFWAGIEGTLRSLVDTKYQARMDEVTAREHAAAGEMWKAQAWHDAQALPAAFTAHPKFRAAFDNAVAAYNDDLAAGRLPEVRTKEDLDAKFREFFGARIFADPEMRRAFAEHTQREKEAAAKPAAPAPVDLEQVKREAVEAYKADIARKREAAPPHPLGPLAGASRDRGPSEEQAQQPAASIPPQQLRKELRKRAAQRGAQRTGT